MTGEADQWGPVLTTIEVALQDEERADNIRFVSEGRTNAGWMRFRGGQVRAKCAAEIGLSIARGLTPAYKREGDGRVCRATASDLSELDAWLRGERGKLVKRTSFDRLGRPGESSDFAPANGGWMSLLVRAPVDWTAVRALESDDALPRKPSDNLGPKSRKSHLIVISGLMNRAGRLSEMDEKEWTSQVLKDIQRAGHGLDDSVAREILKAAAGLVSKAE